MQEGYPSPRPRSRSTVLGVLALLRQRWAWPVAVLIALINFSRIYLGVHYPLDILGGIRDGGPPWRIPTASFRVSPDKVPQGVALDEHWIASLPFPSP